MATSARRQAVAVLGRSDAAGPAGATSEAVRQFETTYDVSLPAEVRDYFLKQDGMSSDWRYAKDKEEFSLWELARVRPAAEELADASPPITAGPELAASVSS